jgi:hypothetical protein
MDCWEPAYDFNGHTSKRFAHCKFGIYLIRNKYSKKIHYIGMSRYSVYKALYRHFEKWNDHQQYRVIYNNRNDFEVRVILLQFERVCNVEQRLIRYFKPIDNAEYYDTESETTIDEHLEKDDSVFSLKNQPICLVESPF